MGGATPFFLGIFNRSNGGHLNGFFGWRGAIWTIIWFEEILFYPRITMSADNKQLLDEVFVIFGIIKVEVSVISRSRRLRLITLTETLIIRDITKTSSNNCLLSALIVIRG